MKKSYKSSFVILIFVTLKFRNPGRSTFDHSIFCIPSTLFTAVKCSTKQLSS